MSARDELTQTQHTAVAETPLHRESLSHDVHGEGGGHGGTEMGWLVSYADMMTLLFGLFVILYSLASDKTKDVEQVMKQVSDKFFQAPPSPAAPPTPAEPEAPTATEELTKTFEAERKAYEDKVMGLEKRIGELSGENETLQKTADNLGKKIKSNEGSDKTEIMKDELAKARQKIKEYEKELSINRAPTQSYMMVMIQWETEKHDLDLSVTTPSGKVFNFKRRELKDEPGVFELDSRFGPGMEVWKSINFSPGRYKAHVNMYSMNGNSSEAKAHLSVMTNLSTFKVDLPALSSKQKQADVFFKIDKDGAVEIEK